MVGAHKKLFLSADSLSIRCHFSGPLLFHGVRSPSLLLHGHIQNCNLTASSQLQGRLTKFSSRYQYHNDPKHDAIDMHNFWQFITAFTWFSIRIWYKFPTMSPTAIWRLLSLVRISQMPPWNPTLSPLSVSRFTEIRFPPIDRTYDTFSIVTLVVSSLLFKNVTVTLLLPDALTSYHRHLFAVCAIKFNEIFIFATDMTGCTRIQNPSICFTNQE